MSKLDASMRKKLADALFGLPGERKYPMPDRNHAADAKSRASYQVKAGNLTESQEAQIDAKANKILGK